MVSDDGDNSVDGGDTSVATNGDVDDNLGGATPLPSTRKSHPTYF